MKGDNTVITSKKSFIRLANTVVIATTLLALSMSASAAGDRYASLGNGAGANQAVFATVGDVTRAPIGWVDFCQEYRGECNTKPSAPRDIVLTSKTWEDLIKVNNWVNQSIKPVTDIEHWGVVERWNLAEDGYGDCEDYVLVKRRMLMQAGWPREALLITVVRDKKGHGHAVLTVKTDRGEFILDNQEAQVLPWTQTGYKFVKRQSQSDQNQWVALGEPRNAPATVSAR